MEGLGKEVDGGYCKREERTGFLEAGEVPGKRGRVAGYIGDGPRALV